MADAIREKMPGATVVEHKCGLPFMVYSTVDGKKSTKECLPLYFFCPACVASGSARARSTNADLAVAASESGGGPKAETWSGTRLCAER